MKVKKIDVNMTSNELLEELNRKKVGGGYTLSREACKIIEELPPARLVQAARAEIDVSSPFQKLSKLYPKASAKTIEEIVVALTRAEYILNEELNYSYVRRFLAEEVFDDLYGSTSEYEGRVPFNEEKMHDFDEIIRDTLTESEYEIVIDQVFEVCDYEDYDDPERANWLYELAISKLKADLEEIDWLRTREVADEYLDYDDERYVTDLEAVVYKNVNKDLRRVYKGKRRPYRVSPFRLK